MTEHVNAALSVRTMQELSVIARPGRIEICQNGIDYDEGADVVAVTPEQIELLIEWLRDAARSAREKPAESRCKEPAG